MIKDTSEAIWKKIQKGVFVIAEAGKNFLQTEKDRPVEEYLQNAKALVDAAVESGANAIKFQTHNAEDEQLNIEVVSPHFLGSNRYKWVNRNEKAAPIKEFWLPLKEYCKEKGIIFFSTPMSRGAAQKLKEQIGVNLWKVGSGDILDFVMLDYMRESGLPIILSSGMSTLEEVEKAVNFLREKNNRVALLHCVSKYPCPPEELNLSTITYFQKKFDMPIGFSDHSIGVEQDLAAIAIGAKIIEKHFSLSRDLWGSDHKVSMLPKEMRQLVNGIKELKNNPEKRQEILASDFIKKGLGNPEKILQDDEAVFRPLFRRSLMAGQDMKAGEEITKEKIYSMRPQKYAGGLSSEEYENVLGRTSKKDLKKFDPITWGILE